YSGLLTRQACHKTAFYPPIGLSYDRINIKNFARYAYSTTYYVCAQVKRPKVRWLYKGQGLVEFIEWPEGFGMGTQSHPELKSRPESPAPTFLGLIEAAKKFHSNGSNE
ncbi:hypothetical protein B1B_17654, partial [mine drainage metagenome]